jgi:hypothetical protein
LVKSGALNPLMEGEFRRGRAKVMPVRALTQEELDEIAEAEILEAQAVLQEAKKKQQQEQGAHAAATEQKEKDRIKRAIRNAAIPHTDVEVALFKKW